MSKLRQVALGIKAVQQLGIRQVGYYAGYQLGLRSGYFKWITQREPVQVSKEDLSLISSLNLPAKRALESALGEEGKAHLYLRAQEVTFGKIRLFGGDPVPLRLESPCTLGHWTDYELHQNSPDGEDIKLIWEQGRFAWVYLLARAFRISGEADYAETFWNYTEQFLTANPPQQGPHWVSAQEVALRLIALAFASQAFFAAPSTTQQRLARLGKAIADHAQRIPPTLVYARAQNNNHLLSEAAGLYTAGLFLPAHPQAVQWRDLGWKWFHRALQDQIAEDGTYIQHSTNYHRLMLQIALWVFKLARWEGRAFPARTRQRLALATRWLLDLLDPPSGQVPNLGPNDGAYILPLTSCPFEDYRPVLQAASLAFLGRDACSPGEWDEMGLWLLPVGKYDQQTDTLPERSLDGPLILRSQRSWAFMRVAQFTSRPGHADQLHLDLWWRGLNVAQDAGTYRYNDSPPWDNPLARTGVHNTLLVNGIDQMTYAGRFLWLDWAQGEMVSRTRTDNGSWGHLTARHDGYRRFGLYHQRAVTTLQEDHWYIQDRILLRGKGSSAESDIRLHWLMLDWEWEIQERGQQAILRLLSPYGWVSLRVRLIDEFGLTPIQIQLVRAGEQVYGTGEFSPNLGWISRIYNEKKPALSFVLTAQASPEVSLLSEWHFPQDNERSMTE